MSKIVSPYRNIKQYTRISIEPFNMNSDIKNNMKIILKKKIEKKCNKNGFVDEVYRILEYSDGIMPPENLNGSVIYNITYHCKICIPVENTIIICQIKVINQELIIAINGPIMIFIPKENIEIELARMGGGFGRRAYGHYMVEAVLISKQANAPVKLIYKREDDVSAGIYRPMYQMTYRAAFDENKRLTAMHIKGGGVPESPLHANRFPAGALDNYLAESWAIPSNITIGAFRAPRSNFNAAAEQSFLDEISEYMGKDPIAFRLELLQRAKENPVGKSNDYDAARYMGVLELVRDKSGWGKAENAGKKRGVSAYFCHNSYAAQVIDLHVKDGQVIVDQVTSALDCGVVVNPEGAKNMAEGAAIDGIGNALFGQLTLTDGRTDQKNFDTYRMIRHNEAPKKIDVHFVQNEVDPTGLGEPPFPPIFGAMANALYKATGKRFYKQPFMDDIS